MAQEFGFLTLDTLKHAIIKDRLKSFNGNQTKTAQSLGISRVTLDKAIEDYEKKDAAEKATIEANQARLSLIYKQTRGSGWEFDPNTGDSFPVKTEGIPPVKLFKRPDETEPLATEATRVNDQIRQGTQLLRDPKAPPDRSGNSVVNIQTEATKEHERFKGLDLTPLSVRKGLDHRGQDTQAKPQEKPKAEKPKGKREKAGRKAS